MKTKILLSSVLTIALCLCLIAGSTFALFTDSTEFNIAVTSGDVEIYAHAGISAVYSAIGTDGEAEDQYLIDEKNHNYIHEMQQPKRDRYYFWNGGEAKVDGANLTITRMTPGDRVDLEIIVDNKSDVAISYRYILKADDDSTLPPVLAVTVSDENGQEQKTYEAMRSWTSEWYTVVPAPDGSPQEVPTKVISLEMPVYVGNDYQTEHTENLVHTAGYTITVEAVQGNAVTDNESQVTLYPTQRTLQNAINFDGVVSMGGRYLYLDETLEVYNETTLVDGHIDGSTVAFGDLSAALFMQNGDLTVGKGMTVNAGADAAIFGMYANSLTLEAGSKIIVPRNSNAAAIYVMTLNKTFDLYLNDIGLIQGGSIIFGTSGTYNIYVPTNAAKAHYEAMIVDDGTAKTINWYVDGVLVP